MVTLGALGIVALVVPLVVAFAVFRSLSKRERGAVIAFLIVTGFILILTIVGAEIGAIEIMTGVFIAVFGLVIGDKNRSTRYD